MISKNGTDITMNINSAVSAYNKQSRIYFPFRHQGKIVDRFITTTPEKVPAAQGLPTVRAETLNDISASQPPAVSKTKGVQSVAPASLKQNDSAATFIAHTLLTPRSVKEDRVREAKKQRKECPFKSPQGECLQKEIRCGERSQYSLRENSKQNRLPHQCFYTPHFIGDHILIVDDNNTMVDFCLNSLKLFAHYPNDKIITASSGALAIERLKSLKLQNRKIGLVVINLSLPEMSGYTLVNELYTRNYDTEIVLINNKTKQKPLLYHGDKKITESQTFVSATIEAPFHSEEFIGTLKGLTFGTYL